MKWLQQELVRATVSGNRVIMLKLQGLDKLKPYLENYLDSPRLGSNYPLIFKIEMLSSSHSQKGRKYLNILVSRIFRDVPWSTFSCSGWSTTILPWLPKLGFHSDPRRLSILEWKAHGNSMFCRSMGSSTEESWQQGKLSQNFLTCLSLIFLIYTMRQFIEL